MYEERIDRSRNKSLSRSNEKLQMLRDNAGELLFSCTSIFPFTLFPDTVSIDPNKVDITHRLFFFSKNIRTLLIEDIRFVNVATNLFFAQLHFEVVGYEKNPDPVRFLSKKDAIKAKQIITGLIAARKKNVSLKNVKNKSLTKSAKKIGARTKRKV